MQKEAVNAASAIIHASEERCIDLPPLMLFGNRRRCLTTVI
jgi:hypothetical protein